MNQNDTQGRYPAGRNDGPSSDDGVRKFNPRMSRFKKKECKFCVGHITELSYKHVDKLLRFTSERGKILPRRVTGNCAKHQRMLTREVKVARLMAMLPFVRD
jgi:small subunit ribosomal protein S18